jgi:hypothetical protein
VFVADSGSGPSPLTLRQLCGQDKLHLSARQPGWLPYPHRGHACCKIVSRVGKCGAALLGRPPLPYLTLALWGNSPMVRLPRGAGSMTRAIRAKPTNLESPLASPFQSLARADPVYRRLDPAPTGLFFLGRLDPGQVFLVGGSLPKAAVAPLRLRSAAFRSFGMTTPREAISASMITLSLAPCVAEILPRTALAMTR